MAIVRTVLTFAAGYAAARLVDRWATRSGTSAEPQKPWSAQDAEAWMKARADRFRDTYTGPQTGPKDAAPDRPEAG